ncbi:sensor histidine kinase LiaS [Peptococcaceae bacterium CEB3]|nr:sensor histidine kinase LiaS [Peptococcaceae bacterium CEB3]
MAIQFLFIDYIKFRDFVHGLVYFSLGIGIFMQHRSRSPFPIIRNLWLLGLFSVLHGLSEWGELFYPLETHYDPFGTLVFLQGLQYVFVLVSYVALYAFGLKLLTAKSKTAAESLAVIILLLWLALSLSLTGLPSLALETKLTMFDTYTRYCIALPAALVAAFALFRQRAENSGLMASSAISRLLLLFSLSFGLFAVFEGIFVLPTGFFPANWLNEEWLRLHTGIPVEIYRTAVGIGIFILTFRLFNLYYLETEYQIEKFKGEQIVFLERERISRDLHDGILQNLYGLGLRLSHCLSQLPPEAEAVRREITEIIAGANQAIADTRQYVHRLKYLNSTSPDLLQMLDFLAREYKNNQGLTVSVHSRPLSIYLTPEQHYQLYHVAMEALTNVVRHAGVHEAEIHVELRGNQLHLHILDHGSGFRPGRLQLAESREHQGITNMQERAKIMGGILNVRSAPGKGTNIGLRIPFVPALPPYDPAAVD